MKDVGVLVVGCGTMGSSHARAYRAIKGFRVAGLVDSRLEERDRLAQELGGVPRFARFEEGFARTEPQAVSLCTYPDTHAQFALEALNHGAHVFVEKPIAMTVAEAEKIKKVAQQRRLKVVVGYILRHHPAWVKFIEIARTLGKPLVMRMNLNQQSAGSQWQAHKNLLNAMSPIVDCGVHYVDIMCQMTRSKPTRVSAIGARLCDEIRPDIYNYGQLQVAFEDKSVGWYEAGWGPMMSETAYFIKDVVGPRGCVSIVDPKANKSAASSSDIDSHTKTNCLQVHSAQLDSEGRFAEKDTFLDTTDEPSHQELCNREQAYFLKAITEDLDLTAHLDDAINSLRIVLAADESVKTGNVVRL